MSAAQEQKHRRARLLDLLNHEDFGGVKARLGRAMGYDSGAFVRQLLDGDRAITEKTVWQVESMRGRKYIGWFGEPPQVALAPGSWPLSPFVDEQEWDNLQPEQRAVVAWKARETIDALKAAGAATTSRPSSQSKKQTGTNG